MSEIRSVIMCIVRHTHHMLHFDNSTTSNFITSAALVLNYCLHLCTGHLNLFKCICVIQIYLLTVQGDLVLLNFSNTCITTNWQESSLMGLLSIASL